MFDALLERFKAPLDLAGRVLIALLFVGAGWSKVGSYDGTAAYMESMGVPGGLLPLVILLELGGGLAIIAGFQVRLVALALAGFCVMSGLLFHGTPQDQVMLLKNIALAGGFLFLAANGAGAWSLDARRRG